MGDFVSLWRHNPLAIGAADDGDGVEQGLGVRPLSSLTAAAPSGPNSGTSPMSSSFRAQGVSDDPMGAPRLSGGMAPASSPHGVQSPYAMGLTRTSSQANSQASSGSMSGPAAPASKGGAGPSRTPSVMSSGPSMTRAGSGKGPLEALRDELFAGLDDAFDEPAASRGPAQTSTSILDSTAAAPDRTQGSAPAPGRRAGQDPGSAAAAASQMVQSTASLPRHISAAASISDPVQLERPASAGVRERRSSGMGGSDVASEASSKHWGSDAGSAAQGTGNVGSVASGGGAQNGASSNAGARTTAPAGGSGAGAPPVPPPRPTGEATGLLGQVIAAIADPQPQPFPLHKQQPNSSHGGQGTRRSSNASAPQIPQVPVAESSLEPHEYVEPEVESYADGESSTPMVVLKLVMSRHAQTACVLNFLMLYPVGSLRSQMTLRARASLHRPTLSPRDPAGLPIVTSGGGLPMRSQGSPSLVLQHQPSAPHLRHSRHSRMSFLMQWMRRRWAHPVPLERAVA